MKGYANQALYVDLSKKEFKIKKLSDEYIRKWLGGNGFGIEALYKITKKGIKPNSKSNAIIFTTGPLTNTGLPGSGKVGVYAKSPQTGFMGESFAGSGMGEELKKAGYDYLVIQGEAKTPTTLIIQDKKIKFVKSNEWGKDIYYTEKTLRKKYENSSVTSIGPAGENGVLFAHVRSDGRDFGRTGIGAVMGYKKLKAIIVKGNGKAEFHYEELLNQAKTRIIKRALESEDKKENAEGGTGGWIVDFINNAMATLPTNNWQKNQFSKVKGLDSYKWREKYGKKLIGCPYCVIPCGVDFRNGSTQVDGPEYETLYSLGSNLGIGNIGHVARLNLLADKYGMDTISLGVVLSFAAELSQRKIIKEKIKFGDIKAMENLTKKIAFRKGIGNILADGTKKAAEYFGKETKKYAIEVKGLELPAYDVRGIQGLGLGFATSTRGACHLRSAFYSRDFKGASGNEKLDRFSMKKKPKYLIHDENRLTLLDSLILCKFYRNLYMWEDAQEIMYAITGIRFEKEEVKLIEDRIWNMEKLYNIREGWTIADDYLPWRVTHEGQPTGPKPGAKISQKAFENALQEYYKLRGWTTKGLIGKKKIKGLGLSST
ncbi:MAG: aldehyde ferredoxin oxidoreductase family protein [Candidatus Diapherotrites archaeon]|nr:aldehyde ferredoxin oxidoreductase family protein [Candidatus Diapherotrites archaeon]